MYTIVGLGNPGSKYQNNRHNVGQMFVDYVKSQKSNLKAVKTNVFMNQSGAFIKNLIPNKSGENFVVVHDDLDIPLGKFKIQKGQGPRLHNGINSIERTLETTDFWRIRIGVDNRPINSDRVEGETYVLQNFTPEEQAALTKIFSQIYSRLAFLTEDR